VLQNRLNRQASDALEGEAAAPETTALLSGLRPKDAHVRLERGSAIAGFELEDVLTDIADDILQEWGQMS